MRNNRWLGWFPILTAIGMLAFWTLFAIRLPMSEPYINWVLDDDWTWINFIGFTSSAISLFAIATLFVYIKNKPRLAYIGLVTSILGTLLLTCLLFFEGFILKGIAMKQANLVILNEGFYLHTPFKVATTLGGILLSIGIIVMGLIMLKQKTFAKWKVIMLMTACPLFGLVIMPGNIRILGVLLYAISFIGIGIEIRKQKA